MKHVEIFYPNGDTPRKERPIESILDDVNLYLMENTRNGEPAFTFEGVAKDQGVENVRELIAGSKPLRDALEKFIDLNELRAFEFYDNRADVNFLALLVREMKI